MWEARTSFNLEKGKVFSWVWRIAQNAILDAVDAMAKHRGISVDIEKVGGGTYELPVPENAGDSELLCDDKLEYYLSELKSERDKRFLLYLADGLKSDEIAKREDIPVNQVYTITCRLRKFLRGLAG